MLVPRGPWTPRYTDLVRQQQVPVVRLSESAGWRGTDVRFLLELPELRGVEIYAWQVRDASVIATLRNLRLVGLECDLRVPIDFGQLPELEVVKARWNGAIQDVLNNPNLEYLNLSNWPMEDLQRLESMDRLARLALTSRKLRSLRGIDALKSLGWLDLYACPSLTSLEGIQNCQSMSRLDVSSCRAVHEISEVGELGSLRELELNNNGDLESLEPLRRCQSLERVSFFGTTRILDGKISVLEELPRLKKVVFGRRRHYDRKREELIQGMRRLAN